MARDRSLHKLIDGDLQRSEIDDDDIPDVTDEFYAFWASKGADDEYPDSPEYCAEDNTMSAAGLRRKEAELETIEQEALKILQEEERQIADAESWWERHAADKRQAFREMHRDTCDPALDHVVDQVSHCEPDVRSWVVNPSEQQQQQHHRPMFRELQRQLAVEAETGAIHGPIPLWDGTRCRDCERWPPPPPPAPPPPTVPQTPNAEESKLMHEQQKQVGDSKWREQQLQRQFDEQARFIWAEFGEVDASELPRQLAEEAATGCQPEEEELLQRELRRLEDTKGLLIYQLASMNAVLQNGKAEHLRLRSTLVEYKKKTKLMQLHASLWRGTVASRKRKINAGNVRLHNLKVDRHWLKKQRKKLRGQAAMKERELAVQVNQNRDQEASIDVWFAGLSEDEARFALGHLKKRKEVKKADAERTKSIASSNALPSSSSRGCQP